MVSVSSIFRHKVTGYEDVFSDILIQKYLPVLNYSVDSVNLDSYSFNVINKCWNTACNWPFNHGKFKSTCLIFMLVTLCQ